MICAETLFKLPNNNKTATAKMLNLFEAFFAVLAKNIKNWGVVNLLNIENLTLENLSIDSLII